MFHYIKATIRERWPLFLTVVLILSSLGLGYMGAQSVTDRIVIQAKEDLEENWRYQYDILVLPELDTETAGLDDGWVAPQSTVANYGGISMDDLETIRGMPGVKTAAPLSLIGYIPMDGIGAYYNDAEIGSFHVVQMQTTVFDGISNHEIWNHRYISEYSEPDMEFGPLSDKFSEENGMFRNYMPPGATFRTPNELMLIAIDPEAEEELYTLSDSLVIGNTLSEASNLKGIGATGIPIIVLANQRSEMTETLTISEIKVPDNVVEKDFVQGARKYLSNLPTEERVKLTLPSFSEEWRYKNVELSLLGGEVFTEEPRGFTSSDKNDLFRYSPIFYKDATLEKGSIPTIEAQTFFKTNSLHSGLSESLPRYRIEAEKRQSRAFGLNIIDMYDTDKIEPVLKGAWKKGDPLDIYTPHYSVIIEDGAGNSVDRKPLLPLPYKDTYYTGSPDAIMPLHNARVFYGDRPPISSIRVIVDGVEERSDVSQRKIEDVAKRIMDETGHHVEIMLGSASGKVQVNLGTKKEGMPGVVEEGWQKAGVSWSIEKQIEKTNVLLFIYLLLISFVFCYTVITHSLLRRSTEFAMLRAIGWSRRKIMGILGFEIIVLSTLAIIPIAIANIWLKILAWHEFLLIYVIILPIIAVGYVTGSRKSLKLSPRAGLEGEGTQWNFMRLFSINGLFSYVAHQLIRRPLRFGLLTIVLALTAFMSILFIATQQSLSDFLLLSFLGETIDLNLKGFQTVFLVVGLILTIAIVFLLIYLNITERKKEFFILRSIGWSLRRIQIYLSIEVSLVAVIGSILGAFGAYALLTFFSTLWIPVWMLTLIIVTPIVLLLVFSLTIVQSMKMSSVVKDHAA
ncbi:FtsX-like permease family protein [Sporosarcina sp. UB5]|uniref:FtsX-like permease family protein n=1 Tax=Sporosarcina sp. UB5 TaxID=3047463 RepID=UPI003D7938F2